MAFSTRALVLSLCLTGASATAQAPEALSGLTALSASDGQNTFGAPCSFFSCQPIPLSVPGGTTLQMTAWAKDTSPYGVLVSFAATNCVFVPGIMNGLSLDAPFFVLRVGMITPPIAHNCPNISLDNFTVTIPASFPVGTEVAMQLLGVNPFLPQLDLSTALLVTVQ